MRAVFYTGEPRTYAHTLPYFCKNILNGCEETHVFAIIQSSDPEVESQIRASMGNNIKVYKVFDKNNTQWTGIRENLLAEMTDVTNEWKHYLRTSGSMIEYYQMHLCYREMCKYESEHDIEYTHILRVRTDFVITMPVTFQWLNWDATMIRDKLSDIVLETGDTNQFSLLNIRTFMNSLLSPDRSKFNAHYQNVDHALAIDSCESLMDYIRNGNYVITLRENVFYICNRRVIGKINTLGLQYGKFAKNLHTYWFNAETQFRGICMIHNIGVYDSCTLLEGKSCYNYNRTDYFDETGQLMIKPDALFFSLRNV